MFTKNIEEDIDVKLYNCYNQFVGYSIHSFTSKSEQLFKSSIEIINNILNNDYKNISYNNLFLRFVIIVVENINEEYHEKLINITLTYLNNYHKNIKKQITYIDYIKQLIIYGCIYNNDILYLHPCLFNYLNNILAYNINENDYKDIMFINRMIYKIVSTLVDYIDNQYDDKNEKINELLTNIWSKLLNNINISLIKINDNYINIYNNGLDKNDFNLFKLSYKKIFDIMFDVSNISSSAKLNYEKEHINIITKIIEHIIYYNPLYVDKNDIKYNTYYTYMFDECIGLLGDITEYFDIKYLPYNTHMKILNHMNYIFDNYINDIDNKIFIDKKHIEKIYDQINIYIAHINSLTKFCDNSINRNELEMKYESLYTKLNDIILNLKND